MSRCLVAFLLIPALAGAQATPTALEQKARQCEALAQAGDFAGMQACIAELEQQMNAAFPAADRGLIAEPVNPEPAAPSAKPAQHPPDPQARQCVDIVTERGAAAGDHRQWRYRAVNACDRPVTVHFCVVDGPNRPSHRQQSRLAGGAETSWSFTLSDRYESPLSVYDACFKAERCKPAGAVGCSE